MSAAADEGGIIMNDAVDIDELAVKLHRDVSLEPIWVMRSLCLLEAVDGTGLNLSSPSLLEDMREIRAVNFNIARWLDNLPGYLAGDASTADKMLRYHVSMIQNAYAEVSAA